MRKDLFIPSFLAAVLGMHGAALAGPDPNRGALLLGGGVTQDTASGVRAVADSGFLWSLRLVSSTRRLLGVEASYTGTTQALHAEGLSQDAKLLGTQLGANLRFNAPLLFSETLIEPFAFGGTGWARYDLYDASNNLSRIAASDTLVVFPMGGGVAIAASGWILDARLTYRGTWNDVVVRSAAGVPLSMATWSAEIALGAELR